MTVGLPCWAQSLAPTPTVEESLPIAPRRGDVTDHFSRNVFHSPTGVDPREGLGEETRVSDGGGGTSKSSLPSSDAHAHSAKTQAKNVTPPSAKKSARTVASKNTKASRTASTRAPANAKKHVPSKTLKKTPGHK